MVPPPIKAIVKKIGILGQIKGRVLTIIICSSGISLALFTSLLANIVRARIIDIDPVLKQLEVQRKAHAYNPLTIPKFVEQRRLNNRLDFRCISWSTDQASSGWTKEDDHYVFFIDYYVPPDKKAIICTTPALATALTAVNKPLLYEIYPTDYGLHIRVIIGVSEAVEPCKMLTGNVNCVNSILLQQTSVRYEP